MLGFHYQNNENFCVTYPKLCYDYRWIPGHDLVYDTICFYQRKHFRNGTLSECNTINDVMCLDDVCIKDARCNGKIECTHGEDEYRCLPPNKIQVDYRLEKKSIKFSFVLRLSNFPSYQNHNIIDRSLSLNSNDKVNLLNLTTTMKSDDNITRMYGTNDLPVKSVYQIVVEALPRGTIMSEKHFLPFICNRGLAVKFYPGIIICFCPPSFYGTQCQYHRDRLTVLTHLNLTNYHFNLHDIAIIKVLVIFLFQTEIIDYYQFHVNPSLEYGNNYIKHILNIFFK